MLAPVFAFVPLLGHGSTSPGAIAVAWERNSEADVAGYKVYWGKNSRIYEQVQDAGNSPQAVLSNLTPGLPYFCAVTAYNAGGQESGFSSEITVVYGTTSVSPDTSGRLVLLEAEGGQLGAPMTVFDDISESWVDTSYYSQLGWTQLAFNAPVAGDYHVWCRVKAPAESKDSFFVMTDGGGEEVFHIYGTATPPEGTRTDHWVWRRIHVADAGPRVFRLDEGSHTLRFRVREPGTLLDRVVLSSDPAFVPSDSLPRNGAALVVTGISGNQTAAPGSSATLSVTAAATGPMAYQWFKDGSPIPGASAAMLVLDDLLPANSGNYSVSLTSGSAIATGGPVILSVSDSAAAAGFRVTRLSVGSDRSVSFEVEGGLGSEVGIYASSDLVQWQQIGTQVNEAGVIEVADPQAQAGASRRFYRLVTDSP